MKSKISFNDPYNFQAFKNESVYFLAIRPWDNGYFIMLKEWISMKKYLVEITETLQKQITVSANSREEAEQKVKERYKNEDIILNENDYVDTDFHVIKETRIMNHDER